MPVCIAGMHRSGTSMVARLLFECGLYLGETDDLLRPTAHNEDGHWENTRFLSLNEALLRELGGGWDLPPAVGERWKEERFLPLRTRAAALIEEFAPYPVWGWKDPRNSLTLPFWLSVVPDATVVLPVRNPLEVARSLQRRSLTSPALSFHLWLRYNRGVLEATSPDQRIVTHYGSFFRDARGELRRVVDFLGLPASDSTVERACEGSRQALRHHSLTLQDLQDAAAPAEVVTLYGELCEMAGWRDDKEGERRVQVPAGVRVGPGRDSRGANEVEAWARGAFRSTVARADGALRARLRVSPLAPLLRRVLRAAQDLQGSASGDRRSVESDAMVSRLSAQLQERIADALTLQAEIARRDDEIRALRAQLRGGGPVPQLSAESAARQEKRE